MKNNYNFSVGDIVSGVVSKILPFGVIVTLDNNTQGLVHISHLHNNFVKNISDLFSLNDNVKVKVLNIDSANNKIALSIKDAVPKTTPVNETTQTFNNKTNKKNNLTSPVTSETTEKSHFETIMSNWQKESNDKIESINRRTKRRS